MVSALWNACTEGDLNAVVGLLENFAPGDIEVKGVLTSLLVRSHNALVYKSLTPALDHTGVTPLIQAVQNGHVEIVKVLLAKGSWRSHISGLHPDH